jgi:Mrp family chromosome partitioning ATPase
MEAVIAALSAKFDHIVIDSPPVIPFSDARVLSQLSDVVILVGRYGSTTQRALTRAAQLLNEVRASLAGVVVNDIDFTSADYRYFNYGRARSAEDEVYYEQGQPPKTGGNPSFTDVKKKGAHA